jgi:hypothetical protein
MLGTAAENNPNSIPLVPLVTLSHEWNITILGITTRFNNFEEAQHCVSELVENLQETLYLMGETLCFL